VVDHNLTRLTWARSPLMIRITIRMGRTVRDDDVLFEFLTLEGAQAGLSWEIILRSSRIVCDAFAGFRSGKSGPLTPSKIERLLQNPGIVRNRLKVVSTVQMPTLVRAIQRESAASIPTIGNFVGGEMRVKGGVCPSRMCAAHPGSPR